jgi:hypothetical protein
MGIEVTHAIVHIVAKKEGKFLVNPNPLDLEEGVGLELKTYFESHIKKAYSDRKLRYAEFLGINNDILTACRSIKNSTENDLKSSFIDSSKIIHSSLKNVMTEATSSAFLAVLRYVYLPDNAGTEASENDVENNENLDKEINVAILKLDFVEVYQGSDLEELLKSEDHLDTEVEIKLKKISNALPSIKQKLHKCAFVNLNNEKLRILDLQESRSQTQSDVAKYFLKFLSCKLLNTDKTNTSDFANAFENVLNESSIGLNSEALHSIMKDFRSYIRLHDELKYDDFCETVLKENPSIAEALKHKLDDYNCDYEFNIDKEWLNESLSSVVYYTKSGLQITIPKHIYGTDNFKVKKDENGLTTFTIKNIDGVIMTKQKK